MRRVVAGRRKANVVGSGMGVRFMEPRGESWELALVVMIWKSRSFTMPLKSRSPFSQEVWMSVRPGVVWL